MINCKIIKEFNQYFKERFSLGKFLFLSFIFGINTAFLSQYFIWNYLKFAESIFYITMALFLFLLRLRLWDEIKDNDHDKIYYSNRPVARGLIPIKYIWIMSFLVLFFELIISMSGGRTSFGFFIILLLYSFLMLKEFLAREWMRNRFTIYIIAHELSVVPLFFYLISLNSLSFYDINCIFFYLFVFCLGCETFLVEIVRKIRITEEENSSKDTYIAQYGKETTAVMIFLLGVLILVIRSYLFWSVGHNFLIWGVLSGCFFMLAMFNLVNFIRKENGVFIKKINDYIIVFVILINISFLSLLI